jgi:hypothetical protein
VFSIELALNLTVKSANHAPRVYEWLLKQKLRFFFTADKNSKLKIVFIMVEVNNDTPVIVAKNNDEMSQHDG